MVGTFVFKCPSIVGRRVGGEVHQYNMGEDRRLVVVELSPRMGIFQSSLFMCCWRIVMQIGFQVA